MKLHYQKEFLHWVSERESIRQKRLLGEKAPWTRDPILRTYRFCNVRRRDDRVSQWIINHIITPYAGHPNLWIMLGLARYLNWPPTITALIEMRLWPLKKNPDWEAIGAFLDLRVKEGVQVYTGAYMIRAESNHDAEWYSWGKGRYVAEVVVGGLWADRAAVTPGLGRSVEAAWAAVKGHYGWGSFMAGQLVADLTYTPLLDNAPDLYTWAPLGPGSRRGLNRMHRQELTKVWSQDAAVEVMRHLRELILSELGLSFREMTLHDVQNCLCEVDKYLRVKSGEGRPRSLYRSAV